MTMALVAVLASGGAAWAKGGGSTSTGYDVSYPQCGASLPAGPAFGIVGVNDGIVYSPNPCLAAEYQWAAASTSTIRPKVSFYANTANPGLASSHWPTGQTSPRACDGSLSTACSYDYGWNAAADSFTDAQNASGATASADPWWLDIETANSWQSDPSLNNADIQGALDYLMNAGVTSTGIYTNLNSFQTIMGSTTAFAGYPSWVPGAHSVRAAKNNCNASITGGHVVYAQYPSGGFDADYPCP